MFASSRDKRPFIQPAAQQHTTTAQRLSEDVRAEPSEVSHEGVSGSTLSVSLLKAPPALSGEIGILLQNNQRQHRTLHIQKNQVLLRL